MSHALNARLHKDFAKLQVSPPAGITVDLVNDNLLEWDALVIGPKGTCFDGGIFRLRLKFPETYPKKPPSAWFYSEMFHPNVYSNGKICLDLLEKNGVWKPEYNACAILVAIQALLALPNVESPANGEASKMYTENTKEYAKRVQQVVILSQERIGENVTTNLNVKEEDEAELIARLNQLDLEGIEQDPEEFRNFLRSQLNTSSP